MARSWLTPSEFHARWEYCPRIHSEGGDFKFRDYSDSIGMPFEPGKMVEAPRARVEELQSAVREAFRALGAAIHGEACQRTAAT